jgi:cell division protein FtsW
VIAMLDINTQKNLKIFLANIAMILIVGVIMVYSSSYIYARETFGTSHHFLLKQLIFVAMGFSAAFVVAKSRFNFWYKHIFKLNILASFLIVLTFVPGVGLALKGASRWISLGPINFQPSEIVKFTVLICAIKFFEGFEKRIKNDNILLALNLTTPLLLLAIQPDFGSFLICLTMIMYACFLSDLPRKYFYSLVGTGFVGACIILISAPYRVRRLLTYLDPWSDPQNTGFQIIQSYLAFANGSLTGTGLGNSNEKLFYLPEAYNDFIFSVVGEELGFIGVFVIVCLFISFVLFGFRLAIKCNIKKNYMFISSVIFLISFQAFLNMGVVLGLLPTKGLNLPFISYGGSSLIMNICAVGMIISALKSEQENIDEHGQAPFTENRSKYSFQG